ncbi:putative integral membrane protein (TIGR02206 family) [Saccharomonospora amisosensis]|uniref:Putative integral membrane protein (TIGR02206 family) n=1 Tax=Saccharomonospora amisosensis TaxID=1128677 RepID=A0A7X5ZQQ1_9PSEU|nr:TIGR02206 family membrane protein [Saccharomonospora amisosensis]NIJ12083.1 putative integral membrane protein (TIGR02206 family) [Saccharomonospora amisosensis]
MATQGQFNAYGPSHWMVLLIFAAGTAALVGFGRKYRETAADRHFSRGFAVVLLAVYVTIQAYTMSSARWDVADSVPLHLSDLAGLVAAYALWSHRHWAFALTYYWCLSLSTQALVSPVLASPDFPHHEFLAFWGMHLLVIWAAIYLTWGAGLRPTWRGYRITVAVTLGWVAVAMTFNAATGTNYGYLNRKPDTGSVLDLLGPWPWYLLPEITVIAAAWALMTWPWTVHRHRAANSRRT